MLSFKRDQNKRTRSYVEEAFRLIQEKPDVVDTMILNNQGNPIKTSMEPNLSLQYAGLFEILRDKVTIGIQKIHPGDELLMLRVRTTSNEIILVPDGKITALVIQKAQDRFNT
ncbi:dynein light chain roadblock-type 2-like [Glossina fuscipes]|uniref:Dynein light chain roadblock-type 2-like n=1 Tax=Glossina fuscipes TaxID=7396 RepID=A0A9C6DJ80_9MUSC|nr:dynein light chain roadblock-type 2-like [Glossina fuscipes]